MQRCVRRAGKRVDGKRGRGGGGERQEGRQREKERQRDRKRFSGRGEGKTSAISSVSSDGVVEPREPQMIHRPKSDPIRKQTMAPHDMKTTAPKTFSLATGPATRPQSSQGNSGSWLTGLAQRKVFVFAFAPRRPDSPHGKIEVFYHRHKDHMDVCLLPVQPFPLSFEMERQNHGVVFFSLQGNVVNGYIIKFGITLSLSEPLCVCICASVCSCSGKNNPDTCTEINPSSY